MRQWQPQMSGDGRRVRQHRNARVSCKCDRIRFSVSGFCSSAPTDQQQRQPATSSSQQKMTLTLDFHACRWCLQLTHIVRPRHKRSKCCKTNTQRWWAVIWMILSLYFSHTRTSHVERRRRQQNTDMENERWMETPANGTHCTGCKCHKTCVLRAFQPMEQPLRQISLLHLRLYASYLVYIIYRPVFHVGFAMSVL